MRQLAYSSEVEEKKSSKDKEQGKAPVVLVGSPLEAKTLYKSPYFQDSYDFPYNPDPLVPGNDYSIYDEMKDDDQVKAVIAIKKDMIINTGWKIECEDEEIKEFVEKALREINQYEGLDMSFEDSLRDILSSYEYGFSLTEPVYELRDFYKYGKQYIYKCLKTRPPHTFRFNIDDKGKVLDIIQINTQGEQPFKPDLFIHHVYQQEFGNPFGKSDLRAAHTPWKAKKFVQKFYNMYLERFAQPTVVGRYKPNADPNEITRYHNILKTIQSHTTITIPEDMQIDFVQPAHDSSAAYAVAVDMYNQQIARSILVPDLMGIGGAATKGGSYALGKEQFKVFLGTIYKDRQALERKITLKLVLPLVRLNFKDIPCKFQFVEYTEDDISAYADLWIKAVSSRIFKPNPEEINHFRSITGFPEGPIQDFPEQPQFDPEGNPIEQKPGNVFDPKAEKEKKAKGEQDDKGDKKEDKGFSLRTFRETTVHEKKVNFAQVRKVLDTSEETALPEIRRIAKKIYTDYVQQIRDKGIVRGFRPEKVNELETKFMRDFKLTFRGHFMSLFRDSIAEARKEILPNGTKTTKFSDALLPEEFEEALDAESFKIAGDYASTVKKKANNILMEGIKAGRSEAEIVTAIRDTLGEATEAWIAAVVRTKTTEVYNNARRSYWENDELASQIVEAYQFSAIMDNRTSDVCSELDGKVFERGDDIDRVVPPLHFNCRSLLIPITKFEDYESVKVPSLEKINDLGGGLKEFKETK